jgi:hypothetical protein
MSNKKDKVVINLTHQGLGDQIICNGLIREIYKQYPGGAITFCKPQYFESVQYMYRDLNEFIVLPYKSGTDENNIKSKLNEIPAAADADIVDIGAYNHDESKSFDVHFYEHGRIKIPHEKRWSSFYVQRDIEAERKLTNTLNTGNEPYIFLHDDNSRNINIDRSKVPADIKIISPIRDLTGNIFMYTDIILNAKEIHCIDSSFINLAESIDTGNVPLVFHKYARGSFSVFGTPTLRKNWKVYDKK